MFSLPVGSCAICKQISAACDCWGTDEEVAEFLDEHSECKKELEKYKKALMAIVNDFCGCREWCNCAQSLAKRTLND